MKSVHWPLMGGLLRLVQLQRGGDWVGLQPTQAHLCCTKCISPPINGQCTNHRIAVQWSAALRFNVPFKGLNHRSLRLHRLVTLLLVAIYKFLHTCLTRQNCNEDEYVADAVKRQVGHVRSINPSQRHVLGVLCLLRTTTADLTCQSPATEFLQPLNPRPLVVTISLSLSLCLSSLCQLLRLPP